MTSISSNLMELDDLLLLYAAGELSAGERATVDLRLDADLTLRAQLDTILLTMNRCESAFAAVDGDGRLSSDAGRVATRAASAIRTWQASRRVGDLVGPAGDRRRNRRPSVPWAAPTAAAAAVILLLAGTVVIRNWPAGESRGSVERNGSEDDRVGGPPQWTVQEREERAFQFAAVSNLAIGSDVLDADLEKTDGQPSDRPARPELPLASGEPIAPPDGPYFDVPLPSDLDGTR